MTFTDAAQPISLLASFAIVVMGLWWMLVNRKYALYVVPALLVALHSLFFGFVVVLDDAHTPTQPLTDWAAALRVQFLLTLLIYICIMPGSPLFNFVSGRKKR